MKKLLNKKWFFGWGNLKWIIQEIGKVMSGEPSFFSQKRVQQLLAFVIMEWGCIYWLIQKHAVMDTTDFCMWAAVNASITGYTLYHVQKEKKPAEIEPETTQK